MAGGEQDILGQIDDDRPRPAALCNIKGFVQHARQLAHVLHKVVVLGAGPRDAGGVGFLESVVADQVGRYLACQADDRDRVHQRVGEPGDCVRGTRSARHQHHADPSGRSRIALGGMNRAALLAYQDVAQRVLLEQSIVNRQHRAARITENDIDALVHQGPDDDFCSAQRLGRHDTLLSGNTRPDHSRRCCFALRDGGRTLVSPIYPVNTDSRTNRSEERSKSCGNCSVRVRSGAV